MLPILTDATEAPRARRAAVVVNVTPAKGKPSVGVARLIGLVWAVVAELAEVADAVVGGVLQAPELVLPIQSVMAVELTVREPKMR